MCVLGCVVGPEGVGAQALAGGRGWVGLGERDVEEGGGREGELAPGWGEDGDLLGVAGLEADADEEPDEGAGRRAGADADLEGGREVSLVVGDGDGAEVGERRGVEDEGVALGVAEGGRLGGEPVEGDGLDAGDEWLGMARAGVGVEVGGPVWGG